MATLPDELPKSDMATQRKGTQIEAVGHPVLGGGRGACCGSIRVVGDEITRTANKAACSLRRILVVAAIYFDGSEHKKD